MKETVQKVHGMPILLPEKEIYSRLGYHRYRTEIDEQQRKNLNLEMQKAFALCQPKGVWRVVPIISYDENSITLSGEMVLQSSSIAKLYGSHRALWIGAATVGSLILEHIAKSLEMGNSLATLVSDATGSETADAAMDFLQRSSDQELRKLGSGLTTRRYSPGYGDWSLEGQVAIFELLNLTKNLNLELTPSKIITPEKSVTAIAGVL